MGCAVQKTIVREFHSFHFKSVGSTSCPVTTRTVLQSPVMTPSSFRELNGWLMQFMILPPGIIMAILSILWRWKWSDFELALSCAAHRVTCPCVCLHSGCQDWKK